jgi:ketosteroid isomerase-like protein
MNANARTLIDLEKKFWQAMVDQDDDTAANLLAEPALMVSGQGVIRFDRAAYRKMAQEGQLMLTSFELNDCEVMFPNDATAIVTYRVKQGVSGRDGGTPTTQEMNDSSTWVLEGSKWLCAMHTETPAGKQGST